VVLAKGASVVITTTTTIVVVQDGTNSAPKLDEFGCDVNLQKRLESKQQARAQKCRLKREDSEQWHQIRMMLVHGYDNKHLKPSLFIKDETVGALTQNLIVLG